MRMMINYGLKCGHHTNPEYFDYDDTDLGAMFGFMRALGQEEECDTCHFTQEVRLIRISKIIVPEGPHLYGQE